MKKLLLLIVLLCSLGHSFFFPDHFTYGSLDTIMSRVDTSGYGIAFEDDAADTLLSIYAKNVGFDLESEVQIWQRGLIWYDTINMTFTGDIGVQDVRLQFGQELYKPPVWNNTGTTIDNCTPVYSSGVFNGMLTIDSADARFFNRAAQFIGVTTHDCPNASKCIVTKDGNINGCNTDGFFAGGPLWLDSAGGNNNGKIQVQPLFPLQRLFMGTVLVADATNGVINLDYSRLPRNDLSKSYPFTSQGITSGTFWGAGFYDFSATSVVLTNISPSISYGVLNLKRGAHAAIIPSGPGVVVGGGVVGIRVNGIIDYEDGRVQTAGLSDTIVTDITTLTADNYYETFEKFSGIPDWEVFVMSGAPTSYSVTVNYGFAKYDDLQDSDFTITEFECTWQGNASNSAYNVSLFKHSSTGWTYAATGFEPGNSIIADMNIDNPVAALTNNNVDGSYKRITLNEYVAGQSGEGFVIRHVTGANSTIQIEACHVGSKSEELE